MESRQEPGSRGTAGRPRILRRGRPFPILRVVRALAVGAVGLVVYLVIPLPSQGAISDFVILVLALGSVVGIAGWAVQRAWVREKVGQRLRLLALVLYAAMIVFALAYASASANDPNAFTEAMDRIDALYFTATVLATVGFGDITAVGRGARLLVTFQMIFNVLVVSTALGLIVNAPRQALEQQRTTKPGQAEVVGRDSSAPPGGRPDESE